MIDQKIENAEVKGEAARPPLPPFTKESAIQKIRMAEDAWNTRDPQKVALAYTVDSRWRNRAEFPNGREEIIQFLTRKHFRSGTATAGRRVVASSFFLLPSSFSL